MVLTPSKRFVNWTNLVFTATSPSAATVSMTGVTGVEIDSQGSVLKFSGDGDGFTTTVMNDYTDPQVTVTLADEGAANSLQPGTRGSWVGTHLDAINKAQVGGGARVYTLANAIVQNNPVGGQHRQYGSNRVVIASWSTDGITNPLSVSAL